MPAQRKRSELKRLAAELAKRNGKRHKTDNNKTAPPTRPSVPLPKCPNTTHVVDKEGPYDRLTDDIIVCHILSRLCLREAVRTSVLARRWRNLWTESISKLIFAYPAKHKFRKRYSELRSILAQGINRVLEDVKPTFNELIIRFDFNSSISYQAIDKWVQIALTNKVTRLHLDFSPSDGSYNSLLNHNYTFPAIHAAYSGIQNLRDVCFKYIDVSKEVIECMMSNCPSLERLAVWGSSIEQNIRVYTQSAKLKSLEFVHCNYLMIEISAPNLIHLRYNCFSECLRRLDYVPRLSQLSIGSYCSISFLTKGARFFSKLDISQLKRLKLDIKEYRIDKSVDYLLQFPKFIKLEQLEVNLEPNLSTSHSHLWLIMLIKAAPSLQKFLVTLSQRVVPKVDSDFDSDSDSDSDDDDYSKDLLKILRWVRHPSLKLIEMLNFSGNSSEMELGQHLLSTSPLLEKFVVSRFSIGNRKNTHPRPCPRTPYRMQAQKFKKWLPSAAKLVIL